MGGSALSIGSSKNANTMSKPQKKECAHAIQSARTVCDEAKLNASQGCVVAFKMIIRQAKKQAAKAKAAETTMELVQEFQADDAQNSDAFGWWTQSKVRARRHNLQQMHKPFRWWRFAKLRACMSNQACRPWLEQRLSRRREESLLQTQPQAPT